ncbi:MAG: aldehyde ferredoxin oxidoreductase, partial [Armatimonadetes bacterium]|nr:aldehyde ferredoxin oxidoreductase [Armatimonadota bacterium]
MSRKASARSSATRKSAASKASKPALQGGYHFRILWVDLGSGESRIVPFGEEFALKYVGGRGFGAKILFDHLSKIKDPLGEENLLIIAPGPLTGCYLPGAAKTHFVSLSPLTGIYGDSNVGGNFGPELRQAGYDALVLTGRAKELSYLWIDDDEVQIVSAVHLAGKGALETERAIKEGLQSEEIRIAAIGPAGEKLVHFATVNCDWSRNAGRCGMGAVMGSKNLKAIAVRGGGDLPVADPRQLRLLTEKSLRELRDHPMFEFWQQQGLMSVIDYLNTAGSLPTRNFQQNVFEHAEQINGFTMEREFKIGDTACFGCPMSCGNICLVKNGKYKGTITEGPEYESACTLGSNLGVAEFGSILKGNQLCDELGIDSISAGILIGTMIEAVDTGVLNPTDVDGLQLAWGEYDHITALLEKIAYRDGVGDILANGSKAVLAKWPELN